MVESKSQQIKPVIFVMGTTGVGKSKLAMDLALELDGEIVNADSMQIYGGNGLGVMTARPSPHDLEKVPHHVYECVDMHTTMSFNVQKYKQIAIEKIDQIVQRGKQPVVVGGTNYYIEALLFKSSVGTTEFNKEVFEARMMEEHKKAEEDHQIRDLVEAFRVNIPPDRKQEIEDNFDSELCHKLLTKVDPLMANLLHPKDKRKIVNALFKYFKMLASAEIKESQIAQGQNGLQLRYLPILVWIRADKVILEQRIAKRIEQMVELQGGLQEAFDVFEAFEGGDAPLDFSKGILQSIGYKEFYDYYKWVKEDTGSELETQKLKLMEAKEKLCVKTVQYANYQVKWLKKRILPLFGESPDRLPVLAQIELNDASKYEEVAKSRGLTFAKNLIDVYSKMASHEEFLSTYCDHYLETKASRINEWKKTFCQYCQYELNGDLEWQKHIKTRKHTKKVKDCKKQQSGVSDKEFYKEINEAKKKMSPTSP